MNLWEFENVIPVGRYIVYLSSSRPSMVLTQLCGYWTRGNSDPSDLEHTEMGRDRSPHALRFFCPPTHHQGS